MCKSTDWAISSLELFPELSFAAQPRPPACFHIPPWPALPNSLFWVSYYCHKNLLLQTSVCFLHILYPVLSIHLKTVTRAYFQTLELLHSGDKSINSTYSLFYRNMYHPESVMKMLAALQFSTHKCSRLKFGNRKVHDMSRLLQKYQVNTGQHTIVPELHSYINYIFLLVGCLKSFSSPVSTNALSRDLPPTFQQHRNRGLTNCLSKTELLLLNVLINRGNQCCPLTQECKFRSQLFPCWSLKSVSLYVGLPPVQILSSKSFYMRKNLPYQDFPLSDSPPLPNPRKWPL